MSDDSIVVVAAKRTPIGSFQGTLSGATAVELGTVAAKGALDACDLDPAAVDEVYFGCVLPAGLGQAPARYAALGAGIPEATGCVTVNKMCGSGMKTVQIANDLIKAGSSNIILAGGLESMSNAPYLLPKARAGFRMGHQQAIDHMFFDGLQNVADGNMMGLFGELTAEKYGFTREEQDNFAIESVRRAVSSVEGGAFSEEIAPVTVKTRKGENVIKNDEEPFKCDIAKIPNLRPAFKKDGTVTAATSSSISDGAAAVILMTESEAQKRNLKPIARILGHSGHAHEPEWFTTTPIFAIKKLLQKLDWTVADVDLYEINEAFACVTMAAMKDLELDHTKVNVNGGACALGHPIGATGSRLIVTLLHALKARNLKRGIASQCIGGGEATAIAFELID